MTDHTTALAAAHAENARLRAALEEIADITERKKSFFPVDWQDQIAACSECRRYKGHPIQNGICDEHRRPIYAQEDYDRHETKVLGYRAQDIARAALATPAPDAVQEAARVPEIAALIEAASALGVRDMVAGWNGEGREHPYTPHPASLWAKINTTCGAVYALDAALRAIAESEASHE